MFFVVVTCKAVGPTNRINNWYYYVAGYTYVCIQMQGASKLDINFNANPSY